MATFDGTENWSRITYGHTYTSSNAFEIGKYRFIMDCKITNNVMPYVRVGEAVDGSFNPVQNSGGNAIMVNIVSKYDSYNYKYTVDFEVTERFTCGSHPIGVAIGNWKDGDTSVFSFANPALYALDSNGNIIGSSKINAFISDNIYTTSFSRNGKWRNAGGGYTISDYNYALFEPLRSSLNRLFANIMPKYIYPQYDGAELNFSVTGNSIGIIGTIKEGASVTAVIDGTTTVTFEGSNRTEMTEYPIAINLQNTTHTVKITANGTNPYVTIAAVVVGK